MVRLRCLGPCSLLLLTGEKYLTTRQKIHYNRARHKGQLPAEEQMNRRLLRGALGMPPAVQ